METFEKDVDFERTTKLRGLFDKLCALKRDRIKYLEKIRVEVKQRDEQDQEIAADMLAGEIAVTELSARVYELNKTLDSAKLLNQGYTFLLKLQVRKKPRKYALEINPLIRFNPFFIAFHGFSLETGQISTLYGKARFNIRTGASISSAAISRSIASSSIYVYRSAKERFCK